MCFFLIGWIQNRVRLKARGRGLHATPVATSSLLVHSFPFHATPVATSSLLVHSFPFRATATMPPRRRIHPRYHGVRGRLDGTYTADMADAPRLLTCMIYFELNDPEIGKHYK